MDSLADSIHNNAVIGKDQLDNVSTEISSAVHDIISSGAALVSCSRNPGPETVKREPGNDEDLSEIVEVDAVELLAEHIHYCEICGKTPISECTCGPTATNSRLRKRWPNPKLPPTNRTLTTTTRGSRARTAVATETGATRNSGHMACVKNHFKRSHCPKMFSCNRCRNKSFSVAADLRSHQKHCGEEARWRCTCGTSFSRKSKLFGHMALFEGHMPAVEDKEVVVSCSDSVDVGFSDQWFSWLGSIEEFCLDDILVDL